MHLQSNPFRNMSQKNGSLVQSTMKNLCGIALPVTYLWVSALNFILAYFKTLKKNKTQLDFV